MKKQIAVIVGMVVLLTGGLFAQSTKNVNMTVTLSAWYDLSIDKTSLSFTDVQPTVAENPGTQAIAANEGAVNVRAFAVTTSDNDLELNVVAAGDLTGTSGTIGIGAISWIATGPGYAAGTMAKTAVTAGSWSGSILHWHPGTFTFSFLRNYATQAPGSYTASATYTLSVV